MALPTSPRTPGSHSAGPPVPADLKLVAETFVSAQQDRHDADYNPLASFARSEATEMVDGVREAFAAWDRIRNDDAAVEFLVSLLVGKKLEGRS